MFFEFIHLLALLLLLLWHMTYLLLFRYEDLHESLNVFGTPVLLPSSAKKHR